jgi:hypothetical protein
MAHDAKTRKRSVAARIRSVRIQRDRPRTGRDSLRRCRVEIIESPQLFLEINLHAGSGSHTRPRLQFRDSALADRSLAL